MPCFKRKREKTEKQRQDTTPGHDFHAQLNGLLLSESCTELVITTELRLRLSASLCAIDHSEIHSPAPFFARRAWDMGLSSNLAPGGEAITNVGLAWQRFLPAVPNPASVLCHAPRSATSNIPDVRRKVALVRFAIQESCSLLKSGGELLFEQPATASSWKESCVEPDRDLQKRKEEWSGIRAQAHSMIHETFECGKLAARFVSVRFTRRHPAMQTRSPSGCSGRTSGKILSEVGHENLEGTPRRSADGGNAQ